ncbi:hypothetical protein PanWU01x14_358340 [Parasponia andersonii]|uniref:Uncharacterized protein n=1 Tax=Parasponia andersonii TaxID=3476 RepID=A0A2P5A8C9_PARAD|nr:hypothetical protein PanWU01x14_358340 [Parasponia andersonii]
MECKRLKQSNTRLEIFQGQASSIPLRLLITIWASLFRIKCEIFLEIASSIAVRAALHLSTRGDEQSNLLVSTAIIAPEQSRHTTGTTTKFSSIPTSKLIFSQPSGGGSHLVMLSFMGLYSASVKVLEQTEMELTKVTMLSWKSLCDVVFLAFQI